MASVGKKLAVTHLGHTPFLSVPVFFAGQGCLIQGHALEDVAARCSSEFIPMVQKQWAVWGPAW